MSAYRPAPEPRQRGPVCVECRHSATCGHRFHGDARLVCLADPPTVISPGRFDHVSGRIVDRVESDPPLCKDLNGEGQCERFESLRPPTVDRDDVCQGLPRSVERARWLVVGLSIGALLYSIGFAAAEILSEPAEDSQGERGEP